MSQPLNLTFGVELEFIAVFTRGAFNDMLPGLVPVEEEIECGHITAGHALQHCLNAANVPATGWEDLGTVPLNTESYQSWSIAEDALHLSDEEMDLLPEEYNCEAIEISSRIFRFLQDDWRSELRTVIGVLEYMKTQFGCNFYTNESTGLHVHVGNGRERLPFETVKRMFQLATAHERAFDTLHASNRVMAPVEWETANISLLYAPLSTFHQHADKRSDTPQNVFGWLARIERMQSFKDFACFCDGKFECNYTSGHSCAVNFENLYSEMGDDEKQTVEFRQHVGTLDYADIVAWVALLATFVDFCHRAPDTHVIYLAQQATNVDFKAPDFMQAIGCDDDLIQHYAFDGEGATIGMLPQPGHDILTLQQDHLTDLTAQNDTDVTENTDHLIVRQLVNEKLFDEYYGFHGAVGVIPLRYADIENIIHRANQKGTTNASALGFAMPSNAAASDARAVVFDVLSQMYEAMYDALASDLPCDQAKLWEPLRRLEM